MLLICLQRLINIQSRYFHNECENLIFVTKHKNRFHFNLTLTFSGRNYQILKPHQIAILHWIKGIEIVSLYVNWKRNPNTLQSLHLVCLEMCFFNCKKNLLLDTKVYCRFSFCKCKSYCVVYKIHFIVYSVLECSQCKFGFEEEFMRKMSTSRG